jgi:FAD/FMN-containing dehydrogenase
MSQTRESPRQSSAIPSSASSPYVDHANAVRALVAEYAALPASAPVRLAKRTSNLFRFRPTGRRSLFSRKSGSAGADGASALDVSRFGKVLSVDPVSRTADVQGMVTYERLVDATLAYGLMPLVVPQLKTITLGGAVVGLGIESSSFRHGLPHESVTEMEVLCGDGRVVVARPDNEHAELFRCLPNSYGTLGYALRLTIELQPVRPLVRLRHLRFDRADECVAAIEKFCASGVLDNESVDFIDGTVFAPDELYLTIGTFVDDAPVTSDYTGMEVYYKSIRDRSVDHLTVRDYLWRWDTDWFWCSRAFGVQRPLVRRLWPRRLRRSDVYRRIVAYDRRHRLSDRVDALLRRPAQEAVVQDVEVPVDRVPEFLDVFHRDVGISPVWLCPLRLRDVRTWPLYPLDRGQLYVNVGFWSTVELSPGQASDHHNRLVEEVVSALGGHKSLYSTVHYPEAEFWRRYNGDAYAAVKGHYDGGGRLPDLYAKCVGLR